MAIFFACLKQLEGFVQTYLVNVMGTTMLFSVSPLPPTFLTSTAFYYLKKADDMTMTWTNMATVSNNNMSNLLT
jgi:hypothetical protein